MKDSYQDGLEIMKKLAGESGESALQGVAEFAPDFAKIIAGFAFGAIYTRPIFDLKQREFLTLASLITQGAGENQLEFHLKSALNIGITLEELIEITMHCSIYAGLPRALNALLILQKIYKERD